MADVIKVVPGVEPLFMQAAGTDTPIEYSAAQYRDLIQASFSVPGILKTHDHLYVSAASGWSVNIGEGIVVLRGPSGVGHYLMRMPAYTFDFSGSITPQSTSRTHKLVVEYADANSSPTALGTYYGAQYRLIEDTGSGVPTIPSTSLLLANLTIPSTATSIANVDIFNYNIIAGSGLSGYSPWINVPTTWYASGITAGNPRIQYRQIGRRVEWRGGLVRAAGFSTSGAVAFTIPSGFNHLRPNSTWVFPIVTSSISPFSGRLAFAGDGTATITVPTTNGTIMYAYLNGVYYDIDTIPW